MRTTDPTATSERPANRAERRAAARGRSAGSAGQPTAPRVAAPKQRTKPVHVRTDFAARRSG
ncbi:hypothetical protein EV188_11561 [Actinomycetospora succinea]|uniref:Uncharacterized protein n=1 Tax=Actinomycetospora succinea TaxID=663603 RepID=A0A4V3D766_9PSEU|nr:hypothetical protein [Actinomycetospora succinea]TDQ46687.1 hypothetical protein EV188_11561 [Actinomycetospora succinea]